MKDEVNMHWEKVKYKYKDSKAKLIKTMLIWYAKSWQRIYFLKNWLSNVKSKYSGRLGLLLLSVLLVITALFVPALQSYLEPYFSQQSQLDSIRALFLTLGGALIGATAIAFSLIMFAMQVNVERMPYGLFKKFSSDLKLLGAFVTTFSLAAIIIGLSLIPDKSWVAKATTATVWCSLLIILLFVFAYRRALALISPTMQLGLVVADTEKSFKMWDRAVKRTTPLLRENVNTETENEEIRRKYDMDRVTYFRVHPNWTTSAEQAISYCITFSRRYAEHGDHEISRVSLNSIVAINALYIKTKGKTFFANNFLFDNPLASDSFLTNTLEHLRQNVQVAISRKDEQFIEQNLYSLLQLTQLYLSVEYGDADASRSHAHLVSGYLTSAVESIIPYDMTDVLIEGTSILGIVARLISKQDNPSYTVTISKTIAVVACTGAVNKNYQPVSQVAVKQLAFLTLELIKSKSGDVRYALKEVKAHVKLIAKMFLKTTDVTLMSTHSTCLGPYYSVTRNDSLLSWLTELTNALLEADSSEDVGQHVIKHLVEWADELYLTEKELLLLAIEKESQLTFDLVHWIVQVAKLFFATSCSDACNDHNRDMLRRSAVRLMNVLSWIPDDKEIITYIENYHITDNIFEVAVAAYRRGCNKEALEIRELLLEWTYKSGKYQTGWGTLKKSFCGLACLNLIFDLADGVILIEIDTYLTKEEVASIELRSRTARDLHKEAEKYRTNYGHDAIDIAMTEVNQERLRELLHLIANHLYSETNSAE
jgi:hypothetical protein